MKSRLLLVLGPSLICPAALAQDAEPAVRFPPLSARPIPLESVSGRFSSLNPPNQHSCAYSKVVGRVVSARLIMVNQMDCQGRGQTGNVLVNVELADPADAVQMVTGRRVAITASFKSATESRTAEFTADYVIAEKAELVAGDKLDRSAPPPPAFMSYMICQPPELDGLAAKLGSELCAQSTIVANLAATGPALETAARAPEDVSPLHAEFDDMNAITCRLDPERSDTHLRAVACARNSYWVWYKAKWAAPLSPILAPP